MSSSEVNITTDAELAAAREKQALVDERRLKQVEKRSDFYRKKREEGGGCHGCCLLSTFCICNQFRKIPSPSSSKSLSEIKRIQVSVILDHREADRASSTHKVIIQTIPTAKAYVLESHEDGPMSDIWGDILDRATSQQHQNRARWSEVHGHEEEEEEDAKKQKADDNSSSSSITTQEASVPSSSSPAICVLFPSESSITIEAYLDSLTPAQRRGGVHLLAIDGTWTHARRVCAKLPSHVPHVIVQSTYLNALFQPLRKQPSPGRVSTTEAVACFFDEMKLYREKNKERNISSSCKRNTHTPPNMGAGEETVERIKEPLVHQSPIITMTPTTSIASSLSVSPFHPLLEATVAKLKVPTQLLGHKLSNPVDPHVHRELLPSCPSVVSRFLRYNLCILVDTLQRQSNMLGVNESVGYRTWSLHKDTGRFSTIPAWVTERIMEFAFGEGKVAPSGYCERRSPWMGESTSTLGKGNNNKSVGESTSTTTTTPEEISAFWDRKVEKLRLKKQARQTRRALAAQAVANNSVAAAAAAVDGGGNSAASDSDVDNNESEHEAKNVIVPEEEEEEEEEEKLVRGVREIHIAATGGNGVLAVTTTSGNATTTTTTSTTTSTMSVQQGPQEEEELTGIPSPQPPHSFQIRPSEWRQRQRITPVLPPASPYFQQNPMALTNKRMLGFCGGLHKLGHFDLFKG